jgi:hypothetical protein
MSERPILFSGEMVRAILDGRKTQTRRVLKSPDPTCYDPRPYRQEYEVGMCLWVRECWWKMPHVTARMLRDGADTWPEVSYDATLTEADRDQWKEWGWKKKPSIHMPRAYSRLSLEVLSVRVERLRDITEGDAKAEGVKPLLGDSWTPGKVSVVCTAVEEYQRLWDSINEKRGFGWDANPWVWVIEFKKL